MSIDTQAMRKGNTRFMSNRNLPIEIEPLDSSAAHESYNPVNSSYFESCASDIWNSFISA